MSGKVFNVVSVLTVVVGVIGVLGPIGWDYYKTTLELELRASKSSEIIAEASKLAGFSISYNGEIVPSLSRMTITLANTGRTPILEKDVVGPVTLNFSKESGVIEAKIESTVPSDIGATVSFDKASGAASIHFPLLNPGDAIRVGILSTGKEIHFDHSARIAGVKSVTYVQELDRPIASEKSRWITVPVGAFSVLMLLVAIYGSSQAVRELGIKRKLRRGKYQIPTLHSKKDFLSWIDKEFSFTTPAERRSLKVLVSSLPDSENFSTVNRDKIQTGISDLIETATPNLVVAAIIFAISALGFYYIW